MRKNNLHSSNLMLPSGVIRPVHPRPEGEQDRLNGQIKY